VEELERGGLLAERVEGAGRDRVSAISVEIHLLVDGLSLQSPAARDAPHGGSHPPDDVEFDLIAGLEATDIGFGENLECFR
jgi:hypothetical protein